MFLLKVFFFLTPFLVFAQPEIRTELDEEQVSQGDYVQLILSVSSDKNVNVEEPRLPSIPQLELVSQNTSVSAQSAFINGKYELKRTQQYIYVFRASQKGRVVIPPFVVVVDGQAYKTNTQSLMVLDAGSLPSNRSARNKRQNPFQDADDIFSQLLRRRGMQIPDVKPINPNEAFAIRLNVDKDQAYVGEQVTANYYLYIPQSNQLRNIDTLKFPTLKGFWKEDIEIATRLNFQPVTVNGIPYNRALLTSYALFPIKEGVSVVDEYKAKCSVSSRSGFGFGRAYTYTKSSTEKKIRVIPLPKDGQPLNFSGAVGDYRVLSSVEGKKIETGQPFAFNIRFEGRGNAKVIELPELNLPDSLELYDEKSETKFFKDGRSFKEFTLYLIPREEGRLTIPALEFSIFNPEQGQYFARKSQEVTIDVLKGQQSLSPSSPLAEAENSPKENKKDFPYIANWESKAVVQARHLNLFWLIAYSVVFLLLIVRSIKVFSIGRSNKSIKALLEQKFKNVYDALKAGDFRLLGVEATNAIYFTLRESVGEVGSSQEIDKILQGMSPSLRREVEKDLRKSLDAFQALSFAPEEMLGDLLKKDNQKKLIQKTEKLLLKVLKSERSEEFASTTSASV